MCKRCGCGCCTKCASISAIVSLLLALSYKQFLLANSGYVCVAGSSCEPFLARPIGVYLGGGSTWDKGNFPQWYKAANALVDSMNTSGRSINVLVLGPNALEDDSGEYEFLGSAAPRMVLVEPNRLVLPSLRKHLDKYGLKDNVDIINAAMCTNDSENVTLFVPIGNHSQAASLHQGSFWLQHVRYHKMADIHELVVPCKTASSLLREQRLEAQYVDILHMDIEGYDIAVLKQFLSLEGFAPRIVKFEWAIHGSANQAPLRALLSLEKQSYMEIDEVVQELAARGYSIYQAGEDFIAVRGA